MTQDPPHLTLHSFARPSTGDSGFGLDFDSGFGSPNIAFAPRSLLLSSTPSDSHQHSTANKSSILLTRPFRQPSISQPASARSRTLTHPPFRIDPSDSNLLTRSSSTTAAAANDNLFRFPAPASSSLPESHHLPQSTARTTAASLRSFSFTRMHFQLPFPSAAGTGHPRSHPPPLPHSTPPPLHTTSHHNPVDTPPTHHTHHTQHAHCPSETYSITPLISPNCLARSNSFGPPLRPLSASAPADVLRTRSISAAPHHLNKQPHSNLPQIRLLREQSPISVCPLPQPPSRLLSPRRPSSSNLPSTPSPLSHSPRIYQTHQGNLMFCCGPHLVGARPAQHSIPLPCFPIRGQAYQLSFGLPWQMIGSFALLIGLGFVFISATTSALSASLGGKFLIFLFCYTWILSLASMTKTLASDPGVLPRGLDPSPETHSPPLFTTSEKNALGQVISNVQNEWLMDPRWVKAEPPTRRRNIHLPDHHQDANPETYGSEWVQCKWCPTCLIYRPPRSSHCRVCDCCIDGIDHHCTYLNTCIGSRNYLSFIVFLASCVFNLIFIIVCSLWKILHFNLQPISSHGLSLFALIIALGLLAPISSLLGYHLFLIYSGITTVEYIKSQTAKKVLAENEKLVKNGNSVAPEHHHLANSTSSRPEAPTEAVLLRLCVPAAGPYIDWNDWDRDGSLEES